MSVHDDSIPTVAAAQVNIDVPAAGLCTSQTLQIKLTCFTNK